MASWQQLPTAVEAFDHEIGLTLVPLAPHYRDPLAKQRVVRRRDPHAFDVANTNLLSLMAGV